jgi:hypothetical protein
MPVMSYGTEAGNLTFIPTISSMNQKNFSKKTGIRIIGKNGHPDVRDCFIRFARWLRKNKPFPIRVNVYLLPHSHIIAKDEDICSATIWIPDDPSCLPYIRIPTGDYEQRKKTDGRDNALASDLCSLCHELIHYWQWLDTGDMWEKGVPRQASALVRLYSKSTDHP